MLGQHTTTTQRTYLSVGYGKIRQKSIGGQKVDASTPGAVKRETQQGLESWAIEYDYITGILKNIFYKESDYGNSFEVVIEDGLDEYQLSFAEDSRFWFAFAEKLPNINIKEKVKITAFDFKDKKTDKRLKGISVEQDGSKIQSHYRTYSETDKQFRYTGKYPAPSDMNFKDKDEMALYNIALKRFFKTEFSEKFEKMFEKQPEQPIDNTPDDLPF